MFGANQGWGSVEVEAQPRFRELSFFHSFFHHSSKTALSWIKAKWDLTPGADLLFSTVFHFSDLRHRPGEWKSGGDSAACVQRKVSHNWIFDTLATRCLKIYILHFDSQESWPPPQPEADGERTNSEGDKVRFSFFLARKKQRKKWSWHFCDWHRVITDQYRMIRSSREPQCDK